MTVLQSAGSALLSCIHCHASNMCGASFCETCGKALPTPGAKPRIVTNKEIASSHVGRVVQAGALQRHLGGAWKALLFVAALQLLMTVVLSMIAANQASTQEGVLVAVVMGFITAVFFALAMWARKNPLPAAICGLVVYLTLLALDAMADPTDLLRGWLIKIIIITVLARAISAGMKCREIERESEANVC